MLRIAAVCFTFGVLMSTGFSSCKKKSASVLPTPKPFDSSESGIEDPIFADEFLTKTAVFSEGWKTLNAKAKIEAGIGGGNTSLSANIRMRRDSAAWISISAALGIEVVRLLFTRDSVFYVNRLNGEKWSSTPDKASLLAGFPLDLPLLQSLLLGVVPPQAWYKKVRISSDTTAKIRLTAPKLSCTASADTLNYTLSEMVLTALAGEREMKINFGEYAVAGGRTFSHQRNYKISHSQGGVEANLRFVRVVFDEAIPGFPF